METFFNDLLWGLAMSPLLLSLLVVIVKSFHSPKAKYIQAIMRLGKLHTFISNVEGKKIYTDESDNTHEKWDLVDKDEDDYNEGWLRKTERYLNVYFFLWPIYKVYQYPLTYSKTKNVNEVLPGDKILWKDPTSEECVVSRSGISDHLVFRTEYPIITPKIETEELGIINTYTFDILEVENPSKILFSVDSWFQASMGFIAGALKGIIASRKVVEINQLRSEQGVPGQKNFDEMMRTRLNDKTPSLPGEPEKRTLRNIGFILYKSLFHDFGPADQKTKELLDSYANVIIAEEVGKATVKKAEKDAEATRIKAKGQADAARTEAKGQADAFETNQKKITKWKKKYLIDTGLAKTDGDGNIIELVPDANTRVGTEAIKELSKLTGTLVFDSNTLNKMLNITQH